MKFKMTVSDTQEVEIPDLPQAAMRYIAEQKASVDVSISLERYDGEDRYYAEMFVGANEPPNLNDTEAQLFYDHLQELETEESGFSGDVPYFQSDNEDGLKCCQEWLAAMKATYPDVVFY